MNASQLIETIQNHGQEIRERFSVRRLAVFGSVARGESTDTSDVDLLVEFEGPADFDTYMALKFYLEDLLERSVDLATHKAIRPSMRARIESEAIHVT